MAAIAAGLALLFATVIAMRGRRLADRVRAVTGVASGTDPIGAVAGLRDQNRRLEAELAADRHDHDLLIDSLAQGVVSVDRGLRIVWANTSAHAFLGRAPGALIGRTVIEAFLDAQ